MTQLALISTHNLRHLAGTEVFSLELAIEMRTQGWNVWVASFLIGAPMADEFRKSGFRVLDLVREAEILQAAKFDLVWIHHGPVLLQLFGNIGIHTKRAVFCSHSHFEPLEAVPSGVPSCIEVFAHSDENRQEIARQLDWDSKRIGLFPNSAARPYWHGRSPSTARAVLRRLILVSNHPPKEVLAALSMLQKQGISVEFVGAGGHEILVSADVLERYDAIVTIGRTAISGIALQLPVYCYDHFGGPGWIAFDNIERVAWYNFSGRGFGLRSASEIASEIVTGFSSAHKAGSALSAHIRHQRSLPDNVTRILSGCRSDASDTCSWHPTRNELVQHEQYLQLLAPTVKLHRDLQREVDRIKSTFSWQVTKPLRLLAFLWRKLANLSSQ